jgi:hypothetical protein
MDDLGWNLDSYSLKPLPPPPHHAVDADEIDYQDYSLVITGDVFRWMINYSPLETLQRVCVNLTSQGTSLIEILDACEDSDICQNVSRRKE